MTLLIDPSMCYCQASRGATRSLTRAYDRHLATLGISISQFTILAILERRPRILIGELADLMVMERTTMVRALRPLRDSGLVMTEPVGVGRTLGFSLSPEGLETVTKAKPLWVDAQTEFETSFGLERARKAKGLMLSIAKSNPT